MLQTLDQLDPRALGQRLQDARAAAGLTQAQVAEHLGLARTTIVAIEKGERRISAPELLAFANYCQRPVSELVAHRAPIASFVPQFRAVYKASSDTGIERAAIELQSRCQDYLELEQLLGFPPPNRLPPEYSIGGDGQRARIPPARLAEDVASAERNRLGLGDGPVADLRERLGNDAGVRIFCFPMPGRIAGLFGFSDQLGACIGLNSNHPTDRQNWSLAHEYGHLLMTRFRVEVTLLGSPPASARERLVDRFAENFLLPAAGLNRRVSELQRDRGSGIALADVCNLARLYNVSTQAMVLRLEDLDRLPSGTWDRLRSEGFRPAQAHRLLGIQEPERIAEIHPGRFIRLAVEAFRQELISEGRLARLLRTDRVGARLEVERLSSEVHSEDNGIFAPIQADMARPLGGELNCLN